MKHESWLIFLKVGNRKAFMSRIESDAKKDFAQNLGNKQFQPNQLFIKMLAYLQENSSFLFI